MKYSYRLLSFVSVIVFFSSNNFIIAQPNSKLYTNIKMGFSFKKPLDMEISEWDIKDIVQTKDYKIDSGISFLKKTSPNISDSIRISVMKGKYKSVNDKFMDTVGLLTDYLNSPLIKMGYKEILPPSKINIGNKDGLVIGYKNSFPMVGDIYTIRVALINGNNGYIIEYSTGLVNERILNILLRNTISTFTFS